MSQSPNQSKKSVKATRRPTPPTSPVTTDNEANDNDSDSGNFVEHIPNPTDPSYTPITLDPAVYERRQQYLKDLPPPAPPSLRTCGVQIETSTSVSGALGMPRFNFLKKKSPTPSHSSSEVMSLLPDFVSAAGSKRRAGVAGDAVNGSHLQEKREKCMSLDSLDFHVGACDDVRHYTPLPPGGRSYSNRREHYAKCIIEKYTMEDINENVRQRARLCADNELTDCLLTVAMSMDRPVDLVLREWDRRRMSAQLPESDEEASDRRMMNFYLKATHDDLLVVSGSSSISKHSPNSALLPYDYENLGCLLMLSKYFNESCRRLRAVLHVTKHYVTNAPHSLALVYEDAYYLEQKKRLLNLTEDPRRELVKLVALYHFILKTDFDALGLHPLV